MKNALKLFPLLLLLLLAWVPADASTLAYPNAPSVTGNISTDMPESSVKLKKPGLFQRMYAVRTFKKMVKQRGAAGEEPSNMARVALILFISYFGLALLASLASFFVYLAGFVITVSLVLSIIVLVKEDNRKSRRIAKLILITYAVLTALGLIFLAAFLAFLLL